MTATPIYVLCRCMLRLSNLYYENNKNVREEWVKGLEIKLKGVKQHKNADEKEIGIV